MGSPRPVLRVAVGHKLRLHLRPMDKTPPRPGCGAGIKQTKRPPQHNGRNRGVGLRFARFIYGVRRRGAAFALWGVIAFALAACAGAATESGPESGAVPAPPVANEQAQRGLPIGPVEQNRFDEARDPALNRRGRALPAPEVFPATGPLIGRPQQPRRRVVLLDNGTVSLNFANVDIREVIGVVLGDTLNLNYVIDPRIQGTVTARTARPIARSDVIPAMENILALNGVALTRVGGVFRVVPLNEAAAGISSLVVSPTPGDLAQGFGTHILPLRFASARSMEELLRPFVGPGRLLRADRDRNLLIFAGLGTEARDLLDMIQVFDVDWIAGMSFALFPLAVADAESLVADLNVVFAQDELSPIADLLRFVPVERLNAILVISPQPSYLETAQQWIERLDRGDSGAGRRIFVYFVQNGRAEDLATALNDLFASGPARGATPPPARTAPGTRPAEIAAPARAPGPVADDQPAETARAPGEALARLPAAVTSRDLVDAPGILDLANAGDIRITAHEKINALLIRATAAEYRTIESTLRKLDIIPLQVLIEATIAEVTLNDQLRFGLQFFVSRGDSEVTFSRLASGAVNPLFPGFGYLFTSGNSRLVLDALSEITDVNVISSPQLMVLDNQTARLQVGDQVPVATQSSVSVTDPDAPIVSNIQFRDTGVILEVTPRVNASGLVVLEILQEVSDVVATTTSTLNSPTIQQRRIESTVAVQSGETIALGGLIRDSESEVRSGIPIISEVPIIGNLFKTTTTTTRRTELLVLITPRVVRDQSEARAVTEELRRRVGALKPLEAKIQAPVEPVAPLTEENED